MADNNSPIFSKQPASGYSTLATAAVTGTDGTDANVKVVFTADATNGSKVESIFIQTAGSNPNPAIVRFWVNTGASAGTAANNSLIHEEVIAAITTYSQTVQNPYAVYRPDIVLKPGYRILAAATTSVATGMQVTVLGGDY